MTVQCMRRWYIGRLLDTRLAGKLDMSIFLLLEVNHYRIFSRPIHQALRQLADENS